MAPEIDLDWIAAQLQMAPTTLAAVPIGTVALLWLVSRLSQPGDPGNYKRLSLASATLRFGLGFACGAATLWLGFHLASTLADSLEALRRA